MTEARLSEYVLDAHALYWYWMEPHRLSATAEAIFRDLERGEAVGFVPWIVVTELHYLTRRRGNAHSVGEILGLLDRAPALRLESLTRRHLVAFDRLIDIPEMHDRMIAAVGLLHDATVVTRDPDIQAHPMVRSVW
jgi:PIN domain nuclease of toxin-antitoxin system